ncbi:hypothetical protein POM88_020106 [Heracleum sosnowskyi]|uniref:Uncharacterized protein n=1 Tax=Heracleum sosnowskyi TaxID=360622 RepID=A0AAD8IB94_9APIA|nr:hypothetical protein POM88_020106 [Heracleum sosnowskyi]
MMRTLHLLSGVICSFANAEYIVRSSPTSKSTAVSPLPPIISTILLLLFLFFFASSILFINDFSAKALNREERLKLYTLCIQFSQQAMCTWFSVNICLQDRAYTIYLKQLQQLLQFSFLSILPDSTQRNDIVFDRWHFKYGG